MTESVNAGDISPTTDEELSVMPPEGFLNYLRLADKQKNRSELLAPHLEVLAQKLLDIPAIFNKDPELAESLATKIERSLANLAIQKTHHLIDPKTLEDLYNATLKPPFSEWVNQSLIFGLDVFDKRNQKQGKESAHIFERYSQLISDNLVSKDPEAFQHAELDIGFTWPFETGLRETLVGAIYQSPDEETSRKIFPLYANRFGLEDIRQFLGKYAGDHEDFRPLLAKFNKTLGFDDSQTIPTIESTYEAIQKPFMEYKPNHELLPYEISLLKKTFGINDTILDEGFGPAARHMNALQEAGRKHIVGVDIVPSNAERAILDNPALNVSIADWHDLPFADGSFDGIYCLGRSILHNTTIDDWLQTLREMHRLLGTSTFREDSPKKVLIDIPDSTKGEYLSETQNFSSKATDLGIYDYQPGDIHDSADNKHFMDRLVPSVKTFKIMADICGFKAKMISKRPYGDKGDINIYWELIPNGQPMFYQDYIAAYGRELYGGALTIDFSRMGGY